MVPGTQQDGHLEDNSNETLATEQNSINNGFNPSKRGNDDSENVDDEENYQQHIQPERSSPIARCMIYRTCIAIRSPDRR